MLQGNEQDEIARQFISSQYDADYANNFNVLQNSCPSYHFLIRDYFYPYEISIVLNGFDPTYFLYDFATRNIQFRQNAPIIGAFREMSKYDNLLSFLSFEQIANYHNIIYYQLDIIPKITNMETIICDAIIHNDIKYDIVRYNDFITRYQENLIKIHRNDIRDFLIKKNVVSEFFETTANENDFYKIPKNHKCVTRDAKALIETLLHFIEKEPETHSLKSGVKEKIEKYIRENNTQHRIGETSMKTYIPNILNWTHKK